MSEHAWFKLLVRAIGILLIGLAMPMFLWCVGSIIIGAIDPNYADMSIGRRVLGGLPSLLGYGSQVSLGLYLLLGAKPIIDRCVSEVSEHCVVCGYDIRHATAKCPECGSGIRRKHAAAAPAADSHAVAPARDATESES